MTAEVDQLGVDIFFDFTFTADTGRQKLVIILESVFIMSETKQENAGVLFSIRIISGKIRRSLTLKLTA